MGDMADIDYDAEIDALQFKRMQSIRYGVMLSVLFGSVAAAGRHDLSVGFYCKPTLKTKSSEATYSQYPGHLLLYRHT